MKRILLLAIALMFWWYAPAVAGNKQITIAEGVYTISEMAPEFDGWPREIILAEQLAENFAVLVVRFYCPCENVVVDIGFGIEGDNPHVVGMDVYYAVDGKQRADHYADTDYLKLGRPSGRLESVPDGYLAQEIPRFLDRKTGKGKT